MVGSKGKGTACAAASWHLATNHGAKVVSITSPHYRDVRERIRVDGRPVSPETLDSLAAKLAVALATSPRASPSGVLSVNARFVAAGLLHAQSIGADVIVLEAGMGGWSDTISECPISGLVITRILEEHLGVLGSTLNEIARDKLFVSCLPSVGFTVSLPQQPELDGLLASAPWIDVLDRPLAMGIPSRDPFRIPNTWLGLEAADRLVGGQGVAEAHCRTALRQVRLEGRGERFERDGVSFEVHACATPSGVGALLERHTPDLVLCCVPDQKDVGGVARVLDGLDVLWCHSRSLVFTFDASEAAHDAQSAIHRALASGAQEVLVTGVVGFAGEVTEIFAEGEATQWWITEPESLAG